MRAPVSSAVRTNYRLKIAAEGRYCTMNANTKLERIRDLAQARVLELQPLAGEEMNLPQTDAHRDGFIAGERALAGRILEILDDFTTDRDGAEAEPVEDEMVMSLGVT